MIGILTTMNGSSAPGSEPSKADAIEQKEKELQLCGQKIDTLNSQLNILEQQLEKCNKEISSLKDKYEAKWKKREKAIVSFMVENVELCSQTSDELLVLYYTNRADIRMSSKKFRKAMDDCKMATDLDPGCLKALLINGSCHLALGEIDEALSCYYKCLNSNMAQFDRSFTRKASDGLQDAKIVANSIKLSAELLQLKTFESATRAMEIVTKALSVSCHSEKLLKMKGEALFQLHKYEEVVQMCEQTLGMAKNNCDNIKDSKCLSDEDLWRWSLMSSSYYRMGKFDMSVLMFEKYEHVALSETKTKEPSLFSAVTVRELLQIKKQGFGSYCLCNRAVHTIICGNVIDALKIAKSCHSFLMGLHEGYILAKLVYDEEDEEIMSMRSLDLEDSFFFRKSVGSGTSELMVQKSERLR
ncbi:DnaJ domain, zinc finger, CCHC-type, tetratricopeptide-like helical domain protein [Tanacetum coccineum]